MRNLMYFYLIVTLNTANALELKGDLTQGGMVVGKLSNLKSVYFNEKELQITANGEFVFGFSRDAQSIHKLEWTDQSGKYFTKDLLITKRKYNIERINGVENKYVSPPKSVIQRIKQEASAVKKARTTASELTFFLNPFFRPAVGRISGVYGSQRIFNGKPRNPHYGLDIANKTGSSVWAPSSGIVTFANESLYYSGGTLIIDHGFGISTTYIHLNKIHVSIGDKVYTGQHIADIGATGRVTGPHLDWRINWFNVRLDPQLVMNKTLASKASTK